MFSSKPFFDLNFFFQPYNENSKQTKGLTEGNFLQPLETILSRARMTSRYHVETDVLSVEAANVQ